MFVQVQLCWTGSLSDAFIDRCGDPKKNKKLNKKKTDMMFKIKTSPCLNTYQMLVEYFHSDEGSVGGS